MDDPELQNSNEEWDEPMSPTPDDRTSVDGPASPDPMSPDNSGYLGRPRVYDNAGGTPDDPMSPDDFGGEEPMSPDNNFRNYNRPTSPGYPMSPENGACSESSTRSEDQGRLRGPATPDGPASPDGPYPRSPEYNPLSPKLPNENADNPRSPDDLASLLGPRSPYDYNSQDGPRSPYPSNSSISPGRSVSQGGYASHGDPQSPDFASQDNPRSPSFGPASPDGPRSPDELGQFDGPRSPDYPSIPDGPMSPDDFIRSDRPQSPDELALRSGPRSPEEHASFQGSASINGSRTFDGQSSMEGPRTPEFPISPRFGMAPDDPVLAGNSLDRRGPMTPDDRASSTGYTGPRTPDFPISPRFGMTSDGRALAGNSLDRRGLMTPDDHASSTGYTESQSMRSPAPSTARSPVDSADQRNDQDDRLSEISEGDSALNVGSGSESEENEEDKDKEQNEETLEKMDTKNKSKRRSDDSLGLKDELDFEAERESGEEDGEEGEEGEDDETPVKKRDIENREDGELSDEEDDDALLRQEPKTVCRFFNKGQCTWGTNCRFLHPGVSDKGNYNMFAPAKPQASNEKEEETTTERERPREVRRYIPEPSPFESAWERGLRYAKEMMKRANKRKETDADFEEKRFNLSLGQAELDRENDYYTRPASPVYKQPDEITDQYLDPFEKQAIRHFRGGHFENFEVRYHVDPRYNMRGGGHDRSRREKYEREVSERTHRRSRQAGPPGEERNRIWQDDRYMEVLTSGGGARGEAEAWADPWARRKTPPRSGRKKKTSRTRSYSTGSSSRSSSSSHSRSRSGSKSSRTTVASRSSKSRSSSRSPSPGHRRGNHRLGPGTRMRDRSGMPSLSSSKGGRAMPPTGPHTRPPIPRRPVEPRDPRMLNIPRRPEGKSSKMEAKERMLNIPRRPETKTSKSDIKERLAPAAIDVKPIKVPLRERLDGFGRIRKESTQHSLSRSRSRSRSRGRLGRTFSSSRSRSRSASRSSSETSRSRSPTRSRSRSPSRIRAHSVSRSRSRSRSSHSSSPSSGDSSSRRKANMKRRITQGTVSYGQSKSKAMDPMKLSGQKQQIKLTLKGPALRRLDKPVLPQEDDSGESDTGVPIKISKRKPESPPPEPPPVKIVARSPPPMPVAPPQQKKPQASRREELLKQLRAVEDAIARKRTKLPP